MSGTFLYKATLLPVNKPVRWAQSIWLFFPPLWNFELKLVQFLGLRQDGVGETLTCLSVVFLFQAGARIWWECHPSHRSLYMLAGLNIHYFCRGRGVMYMQLLIQPARHYHWDQGLTLQPAELLPHKNGAGSQESWLSVFFAVLRIASHMTTF